MGRLFVDSDAVIGYTRTLGEMHKSALPLAIRGTLNDAVYDVKTRTMPKSAEVFKKRAPNFFKANSKFEKAKGFNVSEMKSIVGFYENKLVNKGTNYAVKDLEQQEEGGVINNKSFVAMKTARIGNKMVRPNLRMNVLKGKKFIKTSKLGKGKNGNRIMVHSKKQQFIRAAIFAAEKYGENAFVLGNRGSSGSRTLSKINEVRTSGRFTKGKYNLSISRTPIYSVKKGRVVPVKATNFMKRASMETGLLMEKFYIAQAQKQFERLKK